MNLYDIDILKRDVNQGNLYDLINQTFTFRSLPVLSMVVSVDQEMRIDLISQQIYQSTEYMDIILSLNNIDNPLNIKAGDVIKYVTSDQLDLYRLKPDVAADKRRILLSPEKANIKDPKRQQYVDNNYQLPPTFLNTPSPAVSTSNGNITISPLK